MHTDLLASATTAASSLNSLSGGGSPGSFPGAASGTGGAPFSGHLQDAVANLRALEDRASSAVEGSVLSAAVDSARGGAADLEAGFFQDPERG